MPQFYKTPGKLQKKQKSCAVTLVVVLALAAHLCQMTVSQIEPQSITHRYLDEEDSQLGQID